MRITVEFDCDTPPFQLASDYARRKEVALVLHEVASTIRASSATHQTVRDASGATVGRWQIHYEPATEE